MADDRFGFLDGRIPRSFTPPAGYEAVHQAGMSWARAGQRREDTSWITIEQWNHLIAQFRGLATIEGIDVADVAANSPMLLRDFLMRAIVAILEGEDLPGYDVLFRTGGTMTGALTLAADPSSALHAATKQYVDAVAAGLDPKASVKVASTGNLTLSGEQTIDGVAAVAGDRVLAKNQSSAAQNGIYIVSAGAWTRATDADSWAELPGAFLFVERGTVNADTGWVCTSDAGGALGSTAVSFAKFTAFGEFVRTDAAQSLTDGQKAQARDNIGISDGWATKAIGEEFPIAAHLTGISLPPSGTTGPVFILLTAGESDPGEFNHGKLTSESVSGSDPQVIATAVISFAGSPIDGQTVDLINTEKRILRPGVTSGTKLADAFQGHRHQGQITSGALVGGNGGSWVSGYGYNNTDTTGGPVTDGTNGTPRTANETRNKSVSRVYYMRIK